MILWVDSGLLFIVYYGIIHEEIAGNGSSQKGIIKDEKK